MGSPFPVLHLSMYKLTFLSLAASHLRIVDAASSAQHPDATSLTNRQRLMTRTVAMPTASSSPNVPETKITLTTMFADVSLTTDYSENDYVGDPASYDISDDDDQSGAYGDDFGDAYLLKQWNQVPSSSMEQDRSARVASQQSARQASVDELIPTSSTLPTVGGASDGRARTTSPPASGRLPSARGKVRISQLRSITSCVCLRTMDVSKRV